MTPYLPANILAFYVLPRTVQDAGSAVSILLLTAWLNF